MGDIACRRGDGVRARSPAADPLLSRRTALGFMLAAAGLAACGDGGDEGGGVEPSGTAADRSGVAADAYVFGYPLMLIDATRATATSPVNHFRHATRLPTPEDHNIVRVDVDTLYSSAWLDLREEPMLFEVPPIEEGRYWMMQLVGAWSNTVHSVTGVRPRAEVDEPPYVYAVSAPGWTGRLPDNVTPLPMLSPDAWLIGHVEVKNSDDLPAAREVQNQLKLAPLSTWNTIAHPPSVLLPPLGRELPPVEKIAAMDARAYFDRMCLLMEQNPPVPDDELTLREFATIGIEPGGSPEGVSDAELTAGANEGKRQITAYLDPGSNIRNGWVFDTSVGDYGTNYLMRAAAAMRGLGANLAEEVLYPSLFATADDDGVPIRFRLRFPPGQTPPVEAFWSLTAYTAEGWLVPNPAGIYSVGHRIPVVFSPDGSLELAVQYEDPGSAVPPGNWLPIPAEGQFSIVLRLYAPKQVALEGKWAPPPLEPLP